MKRREFIHLITCSCGGMLFSSCSTVPITKRRQISVIPEGKINAQAAQIYEKIKEKTKLIESGGQLDSIKSIGKEIYDPTANFDWDYILIDNKKIKNAWCMPGGKIAVYTGILEVCKNEDMLAAVMGHEIAHAVAKHSIERASRNLVVNIGTKIADIASGGALSSINRSTGTNITGLLTSIGLTFPFNRKQESEADYLGLIFCSLSGFNIKETVLLWEEMNKLKKGKTSPEWMSTHPSSSKRIKSLGDWIPEIILKYPPNAI